MALIQAPKGARYYGLNVSFGRKLPKVESDPWVLMATERMHTLQPANMDKSDLSAINNILTLGADSPGKNLSKGSWLKWESHLTTSRLQFVEWKIAQKVTAQMIEYFNIK